MMKAIKAGIVVIFLSCMSTLNGQEKKAIEVGKPAPDFTLQTFDTNKSIKLSSFKTKKIVFLNFYATWCGPCVLETPNLVKIYEEYKSKDVEFITVNIEGKSAKKKIEDYVKKFSVSWPLVLDENSRVSKLYKIKGLPTNICIDKEGIVQFFGEGLVGYVKGMTEDEIKKKNEEHLKAEIEKIINQPQKKEEAKEPETK